MTEPRAERTLVKSPPELWAEVSDADSLTRHLGELGTIRITRLDPETTVAWEGDRVRGTVELAASGWGTKVTLTAEADPVAEEAAEPVAAPARAAAPLPSGGRGLLARLLRRRHPGTPGPAAPVEWSLPHPHGGEATTRRPVEPLPPDPGAVEAVLVGVLDELGSAQKRPFSR